MGKKIELNRLFVLVCAAFTINPFTVSKAGEFLKTLFLKDKMSIEDSVISVLIEKTLDIVVVLLLGIIGGILIKTMPIVVFTSACLLGLFLLLTVLPAIMPFMKKRPRILKRLENLDSIYQNIKHTPCSILMALLISLIIRWLSFLQIYMIVDFMDINLSFLEIFAIFPVAICAGLLPVTLSGVGTRDAVLIVLLTPQVSDSATLVLSLAYTFFNYVVPAVMGIPFLYILTSRSVFQAVKHRKS